MALLIAGSTGYIGLSVLAAAITNPEIASILLLTRRDPRISTPQNPTANPLFSHPKTSILLLDDFATYPATTIAQLRSASAAIWCVGTYTGDEVVDVAYPLAFLEAVKASRALPRNGDGTEVDTPFRYVHLGGAFTEPPPKPGEEYRALWYFTRGRRVRGEAEARVVDVGGDGGGNGNGGIDVVVVKPAAVVGWPLVAMAMGWVLGEGMSIGLEELGAVMVDMVVQRGGAGVGAGEGEVVGGKKVWLNGDLVRRGRELLNK